MGRFAASVRIWYRNVEPASRPDSHTFRLFRKAR